MRLLYNNIPRNHNIYRCYKTISGVFGHTPKKKEKYKISAAILRQRAKYANFYRLVSAYRQLGHIRAATNPLSINQSEIIPELDLSYYDLDSHQVMPYDAIIFNKKKNTGTIGEAVQYLEEKYCQQIAAEFLHLPSEEVDWISEHIENMEEVDAETEKQLMITLLKSQVFDTFLGTKFSTLKRYGAEGAESMMAFFWKLLHSCEATGITNVVIGMPHRGRLNVLTGLFRVPSTLIFRKVQGFPEFGPLAQATGDVLSHLTCSVDIGPIHVSMLPNPSHLEAVNPVSMGKTRAKQMMLQEGDYRNGSTYFDSKVLNVQVHGDAAFCGQGINQETLSLSGIPHYNVGGVIHLVVNNQLGFTTPPERGRSTRYPTDLAKMISAPVFHVNGDFPDKVAQVTDLSVRYKKQFHKDVFVNINCYRQWGHNELDDPTFTNPEIYKIIHNRKTVPDTYANKLFERGFFTLTDIENIKKSYYNKLNNDIKVENFIPDENYFKMQWSEQVQAGPNITIWDSGFNAELLTEIALKSVQFPPTFTVHKHLLKSHITPRIEKTLGNMDKIDWAMAESMAIGSLLLQGYNVRLSGQDVGRGTFSHRHAMFVDQETGDIHIPLNHIHDKQKGKFEIANSPLSEEAVLGYEYGMSIENPNNLIMWEAQFGDFFNGAQIIIDTYITSSEIKWMKCSAIVLLLPHGYDGAGPEHSSSRIERFLQQSDSKETSADGDNVNIEVVNPTTPAQYFHLLRRQMIRNYRKPLIIISPKILLRMSEATSTIAEFGPNTHFLTVIADENTNKENVKKLIFTSGKHYYALKKEQLARQSSDSIIIRLESLCPFPVFELQKLIDGYKNVKEFIWSQEEPRNMGAWTFIRPRFENLVGIRLKYVGPSELGTPALVGQRHTMIQKKVIEDSFN